MIKSVFINIPFSQYTEESMNFGSFKGGNGRRKHVVFVLYVDKLLSQVKGKVCELEKNVRLDLNSI